MQELAPLDLTAIDVMHVVPLGIAFVFGLFAQVMSLPPLIGFLAAGFLLGAMGMQTTPVLQEIADLGITLLLGQLPKQLLRRVNQLRDVFALGKIQHLAGHCRRSR